MTKLPFDLQLPFFNVVLAKDDLSALESWVYQQAELEQYLSENDYFELISFDFQQKYALIELEKLLKNYLDYSAYYGYELKQDLLTLQKDPSNLEVLDKIYDYYCYGYDFLGQLVISFGLTATMVLQDIEQGFNFSTEELAEIQTQAYLLYTAIDNGKIILLEPAGYFDKEMFQDLRSEKERKLTEEITS